MAEQLIDNKQMNKKLQLNLDLDKRKNNIVSYTFDCKYTVDSAIKSVILKNPLIQLNLFKIVEID